MEKPLVTLYVFIFVSLVILTRPFESQTYFFTSYNHARSERTRRLREDAIDAIALFFWYGRTAFNLRDPSAYFSVAVNSWGGRPGQGLADQTFKWPLTVYQVFRAGRPGSLRVYLGEALTWLPYRHTDPTTFDVLLSEQAVSSRTECADSAKTQTPSAQSSSGRETTPNRKHYQLLRVELHKLYIPKINHSVYTGVFFFVKHTQFIFSYDGAEPICCCRW